MSAFVRAKFRCLEVTRRYSHTAVPSAHNDHAPEHDVFTWRVKLVPVMGKSKTSGGDCEENKAFYATTPSGQFEFETHSERAASAFQPGQAYYIDFTPTDG